jgi:hypothetical protein
MKIVLYEQKTVKLRTNSILWKIKQRLFLFSHYFLYLNSTYTLNIAISVPAKQVRMLHDREIFEEVEKKMTVKCST